MTGLDWTAAAILAEQIPPDEVRGALQALPEIRDILTHRSFETARIAVEAERKAFADYLNYGSCSYIQPHAARERLVREILAGEHTKVALL